ncbi:MAG: carboxypeptidase M32 [Bacilli bacterium]|nr:carboxypeptidase M32 [Bacilli bacterium]
MNKKLAQLYKKLSTMRYYEHAMGIISFDFETCVPKRSMEAEGDTLSYFSNQYFKIKNSKAFKQLVIDLYQEMDTLDPLDQILIKNLYESYLKQKNITPKMELEMSKVYNKAYIDWLAAKEKSDFQLFLPSFKKIIELAKKEVLLRDEAIKLPNLYDNMLNDCEKGLLQEDLDQFFEELKNGLIELIGKIKKSGKTIRSDFLSRMVPIYKQDAFSRYLLNLNGFDFERGCLSTTEHPFTSDVSENDARVTTHYHEDMVLSNIYSIIHEGGHAILMQNEPKEDYEHFINDEVTNGMHESVSRFFENVIGRSKAYVHLIYPKFIETFNEFSDITEDELYEAINIVEPSLIRTEADEVTYGLHIVIRYEMEKKLVSGTLKPEDASKEWNRLYKEYLGVEPKSDAEGILQDVHWTGGFGYFPSYAIGNAYNAMYLKELRKAYDFEALIAKGDFKTINEWLKNHIFKEANHLDPKEWIKSITNKSLSAKDFLDYLNEKYQKIYHF